MSTLCDVSTYRTNLKVWHATASQTVWTAPADITGPFGNTVDVVGDDRVIFDISSNKYR